MSRAVRLLGIAALFSGAAFAACSSSESSSVGAPGAGSGGGMVVAGGSGGTGGPTAAGAGGHAAGAGNSGMNASGASGVAGNSGSNAAGSGGLSGSGTGQGGVAGANTTAGSGGVAGAGAGASGAAGAPAAAPVWKPFPGAKDGCAGLEILANPTEVGPIWAWSACDWPIAGCQQLALGNVVNLPFSTVLAANDDGTDQWLGVAFDEHTQTSTSSGKTAFAIGKADGSAVLVLRHPSGYNCQIGQTAIANGHYGMAYNAVLTGGSMSSQTVLVGALSPTFAPVLSTPPYVGSVFDADWVEVLAGGRAYYRYSGGADIESCDWATGLDAKQLVTAPNAGGEIQHVVSFPDGVLFDVYSSPQRTIRRLDPLIPGAAQTFLSDPTADVLLPAYTGEAIVWVRAEGPQPNGLTYNKLELWWSPYTWDTTKLAPQLLAAWPDHGTYQLHGGWGRVARGPTTSSPDYQTLHVWDVPSGVHRTGTVPAKYIVGDPLIWKDEIVVSVDPIKPPHFIQNIYRVPVASLTIVP